MGRIDGNLFLYSEGSEVMKKEDFLLELRSQLVGLPKEDVDDRIGFYSEMIDDRIDEGKSEEEAVAEIGGVDRVVNDIAQDVPLTKLVKERVKPKRSLKVWEIILIIASFPIWLPLLLVAFILLLVAFFLLWILVFVTYTVETSLVVASVGGTISFFGGLFNGEFNPIMLGASIMCAGGAALLIFGCIGATKGTIKLTKTIVVGIKTAIIKKGRKE